MSQDDRLTGLKGYSGMKIPVRVATTANITLSGVQTVDGVLIAADDRVLVKNQTSSVDNGVYVVDSGSWERAHDCAGSYNLVKGSVVMVNAGTQSGFWYCTSSDPVVVGTSTVTWAQASSTLAVISAFAQTLIDDTTAGAFLTTLGISAYAQTLLDDASAAVALTTLGLTATADELNGLDVSAKVRYFDEGQDTSSMWSNAFGGTDSSVSGLAIIDGQNGSVRMSTGAGAGATMAVNGLSYMGPLMWKANGGGLVFEQRIKLSAITNVCVFLGFTDQVSALEMPFTLAAGDVLTSNATDACGVLFDTGADTDNWWLVGVAADVDATKQNAGVAPVAGTDEIWRIELSITGVATFYRNGAVIGSTMAGAVTPTVFLTHTLNAFTRAAASRDVSYDYTLSQGSRV